ncbi:General transcription factor IIE subunit 2 [Cucumispora dikerogammari]|nr:General transcription factor IIE subunit 2 [Cucumispora dikerogammari]
MMNTNKYSTMFSRDKHLNTHLHKIITLLKETKNTYTLEQVSKITNTPLDTDPKLLNAVKQNDKIIFENNTCRFKHEFSYTNKQELLETLKNGPYKYGIEINKLLDCQLDAKDIINECISENTIITLRSADNSKLLFYNTLLVQPASPSTKELYQAVNITTYAEIFDELEKIGISKKTEKKETNIKATDNTKKRPKRRIRITNTHIKGLDLEDI